MSQFAAGRWVSNGEGLAAAWNNSAGLVAFTGLVGTDGKYFLPVTDRGGYTQGNIYPLTMGGIEYSGFPVVRITHAWISDGQIETLKTYQGKCTLRHHIDVSVGSTDTQNSNAWFILDLNQLNNLTRVADGWEKFVSSFTIVGAAS